MEQKLRENSHKAHWRDCSREWLMSRLLDEVEELRAAVTSEDVAREAADVANFAMMIADNEFGLSENPHGKPRPIETDRG
jgi:NTP pyrophosphatase (non-canonical NTP hydrolase)